MVENNESKEIKFFPVVHLLTGPPGLKRNGGIWKTIKASLNEIQPNPAFMVQALHFTTYGLSQGAWEDWDLNDTGNSRLKRELVSTFGQSSDIFLDSGGFQLLYSDKIDLSKWGLKLSKESVLELQLKFNPSRIASLDSPLSPKLVEEQVIKLQKISADNATWLLENFDSYSSHSRPYLAVHGRAPHEIENYLKLIEENIPSNTLINGYYGLALGSQVPLASSPELIISNIQTILNWMDRHCREDIPLHIFGVGDSIVGTSQKNLVINRSLTYDNSTYAQSAFRLKMYDPTSGKYTKWSPGMKIECDCKACQKLTDIGEYDLSSIMSAPAYSNQYILGRDINRSEVLAYLALHNMYHWNTRIVKAPAIATKSRGKPIVQSAKFSKTGDYDFPLTGFKSTSPNLLILPCTDKRPYSKSPRQKRVINFLAKRGYSEGTHYDRITVSGLFGPVHWKDETLPAILSYDFEITPTTSEQHLLQLRFNLGTVLNVIRKRYDKLVGFLKPNAYAKTFGPVIRSFNGVLVEREEEILSKFN